ncbi:MAG: ABC transporter permease [Candidatus Helarchaeota archaeon]
MPNNHSYTPPYSAFVLLFVLISLVSPLTLSIIGSSFNHTSPTSSSPLQSCVTYDAGTTILQDQTITDNLLIMQNANVTLINTTIQGSIYVFNQGLLSVLQNSNITENIVLSDAAQLIFDNSTAAGTIESRDSSVLLLSNSQTLITTLWKFNSANLTIINSSIGQLNEFGTAGQIQIINSQISGVLLQGIPSSRTFITNSTILSLIDSASPLNSITGPIRFDIFSMTYGYSSSERQLNLTWIGWDSPILDGYLNLTFQILLDGSLYATINGSGYFNQFSGWLLMNITTAGFHNISVVSIDSVGNNYTTTVTIEIIEYPSFPWDGFIIALTIILGLIVAVVIYLRYQQSHGTHYTIGTIFKKELKDSKIKILIFVALAAAPGIILYFIFATLAQWVGPPSIDGFRSIVNMIFTIFLYYFGLAFSIIFGMGAIVKEKRSGTLSWFLSKPVRRWEYLWGKILAYIVIVILSIISAAISFVLGGWNFINPLYRSDLLSMGGYILIIGLAAILPLTAIVVLSSTLFKKIGLAIALPIIILIVLPPLFSFLPLATRNEWPLLFSFTYYFEQLGSSWVASSGGLFGTIGTTYGSLLGVTITPLNLSPSEILLILSMITIICFICATIYLQKTDIA